MATVDRARKGVERKVQERARRLVELPHMGAMRRTVAARSFEQGAAKAANGELRMSGRCKLDPARVDLNRGEDVDSL